MLVAPVALIVTPVSVKIPFATVGVYCVVPPPFGQSLRRAPAPSSKNCRGQRQRG